MQTRMSRDLFPREVLRQPGFLAGIRRVDAWLRALDKNVVHGRGDPRLFQEDNEFNLTLASTVPSQVTARRLKTKDEAPASTFDRGLILFTFALSGRVAGDVISRTSLGRTFLSRSDPVLGLVHLRQRFAC
jgi:hypothetical protein